MECPKISVITVCYNAVSTIEKTILSVINQTYPNIEYIIIDGASTDGTIDIVNKYRDKITSFVSEPDKGIYDAMNKGVGMAHGNWVFFLNSDDSFYSDNILMNVSQKLRNRNTIYYGDVMNIPQNVLYGGKFSKWRITRSNICHQSIFYPAIVFKQYHYDANYKLYADWVLNISCMGNNNYKFEHINYVISLYNTQGVSKNWDVDFMNNRFKIIRSHLGIIYMLYAKARSIIHRLI